MPDLEAWAKGFAHRNKIEVIRQKPSTEFVLVHVAIATGVQPSDLRVKGNAGSQHLVDVRQIAMGLAREMTNDSFKAISLEFHRDDHTTVMHAVKRMNDRSERSIPYRKLIDELRKFIKQSFEEYTQEGNCILPEGSIMRSRAS